MKTKTNKMLDFDFPNGGINKNHFVLELIEAPTLERLQAEVMDFKSHEMNDYEKILSMQIGEQEAENSFYCILVITQKGKPPEPYVPPKADDDDYFHGIDITK
ncbi:hypothetical protein CW306_26660 [Bacillus sp. BA3]|uniref:hypothetical protein n=1 Tax=Bacillus sp. BA3 TaxID=2057910 RepID=UPI000C33F1C1|nr:hypothetical protein [Bacillus sp. BA3]PKF85653.1 hypothetical protein CW306_26660 [Bacillus sp. BA3]